MKRVTSRPPLFLSLFYIDYKFFSSYFSLYYSFFFKLFFINSTVFFLSIYLLRRKRKRLRAAYYQGKRVSKVHSFSSGVELGRRANSSTSVAYQLTKHFKGDHHHHHQHRHQRKRKKTRMHQQRRRRQRRRWRQRSTEDGEEEENIYGNSILRSLRRRRTNEPVREEKRKFNPMYTIRILIYFNHLWTAPLFPFFFPHLLLEAAATLDFYYSNKKLYKAVKKKKKFIYNEEKKKKKNGNKTIDKKRGQTVKETK